MIYRALSSYAVMNGKGIDIVQFSRVIGKNNVVLKLSENLGLETPSGGVIWKIDVQRRNNSFRQFPSLKRGVPYHLGQTLKK